ncbi:hypothetical protein K3495_g8225 [Podosphaera aphanis]|nr:hypothetical protein K3495_g8225 [Podosphaera aphanis]
MTSARQELMAMMKGTLAAGSFQEAELLRNKYHVMPWETEERVTGRFEQCPGSEGLRVRHGKNNRWSSQDRHTLVRATKYNVESIYRFDETMEKYALVDTAARQALYDDMVTIVAIMMTSGCYLEECRPMTELERSTTEHINATDDELAYCITSERCRRAARFIAARVHTKYQTNYAIGKYVNGMTSLQASIASAVREMYDISSMSSKTSEAKAFLEAIKSAIRWSLRPVNELWILPFVIKNSRVRKAETHACGPKPDSTILKDYFNMRPLTSSASTHKFYVAAAATKQLEPLGFLSYLPEPQQLKDVESGLAMIEIRGAALHPAVTY